MMICLSKCRWRCYGAFAKTTCFALVNLNSVIMENFGIIEITFVPKSETGFLKCCGFLYFLYLNRYSSAFNFSIEEFLTNGILKFIAIIYYQNLLFSKNVFNYYYCAKAIITFTNRKVPYKNLIPIVQWV